MQCAGESNLSGGRVRISAMENSTLYPDFAIDDISRARIAELIKRVDAAADAFVYRDDWPAAYGDACMAVRSYLKRNPDLVEELDTVRVPADADAEVADAFTRILLRVAGDWPRWIRCGPGWYQLILELDEELAAVEPDYVLMQVGEKDGRLFCAASPAWKHLSELPPCCEEYPWSPDLGVDEHSFMEEHVSSVEHLTKESVQIIARETESGLLHRQAVMNSICAIFRARSATTCVECGTGGARRVHVEGRVRTLCSDCIPD
jgi:hypothetical protein